MKKIRLTNRAIKDLLKINKFNTELYGEKIAVEIIDKLFEYLKVLESPDCDFSKIGAKDETFLHLQKKV